MKRSAVVSPAKGEEKFPNFPNNGQLNPLSQVQLVLEELRATTEGMRRIEERITKIEENDAKMHSKMHEFFEASERQPTMLFQHHEDSASIAQQLSALHIKNKKEEASAIAEELYSCHSSNHKSNLMLVDKLMGEKAEFFDPINKICPPFNIMMSHIMVNTFGVSVKSVRHTIKIGDFGEREAMRVGSSLAVFLRKRKTGDAALDAWRLHYVQLKKLFDEAEGCEEFLLVFANNLLRDR